MDDVSHSPSRAENNTSSSLALSTSTSSPRAASAVLLPGLENLQVGPDSLSNFYKLLYTVNYIIHFFHYAALLRLQALASPSGPLSLDAPQVLDSPLLPPLASPTRARSPDVISSASTAMSQDMPEIASQTLQLQRGLVSSLEASPLSALQTDSMASAASALHLLTSPRTANNNRYITSNDNITLNKNECWLNVHKQNDQEFLYALNHWRWTPKKCVLCLSLLPLELGGADGPVGGAVESEPRLSNTPSLLENALSQENPGVGGGSSDGSVGHTPWPAAPDITRETRNSLRDNGLSDW